MTTLIPDTHKFYLTPSGSTIKHNGEFNSNVTFSLPNLYKNATNIIYTTVRVVHAEIPNSFYIINEYNNTLATSFGTFNIPYGNYNANTLMAYMKTVLPSNVTMAFNTTTGKFTLTSPNMSFSISAGSNCGIIFGFSNGQSYTSSFDSGVNVLQLPFPCNLYGTKNIYIRLPQLVLDNLNAQTKDKSTICNIPKNVSPYSVIMYENATGTSSIVKNELKSMDSNMTVELLDDHGNYIDFNNVDWSITLQFDFYISLATTQQLQQLV